MLAALGVLEVVISPGSAQIALECGLALSGFAAIAVWAHRNRTALDQQDWCECAGAKVTMRVIPSRRSEPVRVEHADEHTLVEETLEEVAR